MKNKFFEYYILSDEEGIKKVWNDAIIVLDTNVLLNLYRYSEDSKNNLLDILEFYKDRLWIPYQVGLEYQNDRASVYMEMYAAYDQIIASINKETEEFIKRLNLAKYQRHPKIDTEWFKNQIMTNSQNLCKHLLDMKDSCPYYSDRDEINERITILFENKVGEDFDEEKLKKIYKEGQVRYNEKIPPGYCDINNKKNQGSRHLYGDLILWKQVIQFASERNINVIFVTDDVKEDWFERVKGQTTGPRKELIREFRNETHRDILIYPCHRFLYYAKENMSISVNQETISEVNEIHKEDEAISNLISCDQSDNETVAKFFSKYPWMNTESLINSGIQLSKDPADSIAGMTGRCADILGKDPADSIAGLTGRYADILGKDPADSIAGLTGRYADILGKDHNDSITGLTGRYADILGKDPVDCITGLTGRYADILGKDPAGSIAGLIGRYADILGKDPDDSIAGMTGRCADILRKNSIDSITGLTGRYTNVIRNNPLTDKH